MVYDKQKRRVILPDTTLCAIVRDEIMNPAGGIIDFIESTVPYVKEAVIVDGLSTDGTKEALDELTRKYTHLRIFDRQFTDYADQRNYSLHQASLKRALILDADERLTYNDFVELKEVMKKQSAWGYRFKFLDISPESPRGIRGTGHTLRLFERSSDAKYQHKMFEFLYIGDFREDKAEGISVIDSGIKIKHFRPSLEGIYAKNDQWYGVVRAGRAPEAGPHTLEGFNLWKAYNPARENFR